jgi:GAF domain-containing protein
VLVAIDLRQVALCLRATGIDARRQVADAYEREISAPAVRARARAISRSAVVAVATRQPVITRDVAEEPVWKPWLWLAEQFNYRACWSFPVTRLGKAVGSFAMYYETSRRRARDQI